MPFDARSTQSETRPLRRRGKIRQPLAWRVPVLGPILRELVQGDPDFPLYAGFVLLSLMIMSVMTWGLPALVISALLATPVAGLTLVAITRG